MIGGLFFSRTGTFPAVVVQTSPHSLGESIQTGLLVGAVVLLLAGSLLAIRTSVDVGQWVPIHLPVRSVESNRSRSEFEEPVDDRDRVLSVIEQENGQLMQSRIVEKTDYSKVKTSRILTELTDDGDVIKVPVGRQNLICLPGNAPEILSEAQTPERMHALKKEERTAPEIEEGNRST